MAAMSASVDSIKPHKFDRHAMGDVDVCFDIAYCGICHTDVHFIQNALGFSQYPLVPGHELIGTVTAVGSKVTKFKVGEKIGVGCMVDACMSCDFCKRKDEQYCATGSVVSISVSSSSHKLQLVWVPHDIPPFLSSLRFVCDEAPAPLPPPPPPNAPARARDL